MPAVRILLFVLGAFLLPAALWGSRTPDGQAMEKQVYAGIAAGCAALPAGGLFLPMLLEAFRRYAVIRVLCIPAGLALLLLLAAAGLIIAVPFLVPRADGSEAVLIVLGAPVVRDRPTLVLRSRAELASAWMRDHPDARAYLSGGKGGIRTEAETIAALLEARGIARRRMRLDNSAATTVENFRNVKAMLADSCDVSSEPVAVLSSRFHIFRLRGLLKKEGFGNVRFVMVPAPAPVRLLWYVREMEIILRYWLTGKNC